MSVSQLEPEGKYLYVGRGAGPVWPMTYVGSENRPSGTHYVFDMEDGSQFKLLGFVVEYWVKPTERI